MPSDGGAILNIGCGSSLLAEELHADGFRDVTNVDISSNVVEQMSKRYSSLGYRWQVMDVTKMTFPESKFDVIFDKGTLDALYSGDQPGVVATMEEVYRVLKPGGAFFSVTFGEPERRTELKRPNWASFTTHKVRVAGSPNGAEPAEGTSQVHQTHFVHVMRKPSA